MESKTPKFDVLLDGILETLSPHKRTCTWKGRHSHCEGEFEIVAEDIQFLKMLRVPPPNYCPTCRRMRRLTHLNLTRFFKRPCDVSGHEESLISVFPEECPFPVFDAPYYISDDFDPFSYGMEYEKDKSPLSTLLAMRKSFPMPSFLNKDSSSINSPYSSGGRFLKNGYYVFSCFNSEDIWYSSLLDKCKDVMDSRRMRHSDHVYASVSSDHLYRSSFVYFSKNCTDSMFLFDCRDCDSCFGCVNLRRAKYCVWNTQLSKEDYEAFMRSIFPLTQEKLREYEEKLWKLVKELPVNASRNISVKNARGVSLSNMRDVFDVTNSENSENVRHSDGCLDHQDSMDLLFSGGKSSLLYGTVNIGSRSNNVKFSISSKFSKDSEFIFNSKNLSNCFMCFGLQNKSYCILNKQYAPEEYFQLVDDIKSRMLTEGEYEDGLGLEFSAQAYNFSLGHISFPLTDDEIMSLGGYAGKEPETYAGSIKVLSQVSKVIDEVSDDILDHAILCEVTKRPFRITASELEFYRNMKLPLPAVHPTVRIQARLMLTPDGKKYLGVCAKCGESIDSAFDPKENFILYCEKCYQQEVY